MKLVIAAAALTATFASAQDTTTDTDVAVAALRSVPGKAIQDAFNSQNIKAAESTGDSLKVAFAKAVKARMDAEPEGVPDSLQTEMLMSLAYGSIGGDRSVYCTDAVCNAPLTLQGIWGYGCWCHFDTDIMNGNGPPVNGFDAICMQMQKCLRCASQDGGASCNPKDTSTTYSADYQWNVVTQDIEADCTAQNPGDECAEHMCTCELNLIAGVMGALWSGQTYDATYLHDNGFDFQSECPNAGSIASEKSCCGYYDAAPFRRPYVADTHSCCEVDQQTYNDATQECCPGSGVQAIGDC
jgi:hypothetical protein